MDETIARVSERCGSLAAHSESQSFGRLTTRKHGDVDQVRELVQEVRSIGIGGEDSQFAFWRGAGLRVYRELLWNRC